MHLTAGSGEREVLTCLSNCKSAWAGRKRTGYWTNIALFRNTKVIDIYTRGPSVQHREHCSIFCNNLNERNWTITDTCKCITKSFCCILETNTIQFQYGIKSLKYIKALYHRLNLSSITSFCLPFPGKGILIWLPKPWILPSTTLHYVSCSAPCLLVWGPLKLGVSQGYSQLDFMPHCCHPVTQSCLTLWLQSMGSCQASLSLTISWSLPKFMSIVSVKPSSHLILQQPLLLLPSILPSIRDFSNELDVCIRWPKYWSFSSSPSNEY